MAAYVNLIPFNPWRGAPPSYQRPSDARIAAFQAEVEAGGVSVALRTTRGDDIDAACGQLNSSLATEGASAAEKLPDLVRAHRKFSTHCW
jgi:23S rRNA (adenine2503-C2)-methyltransferase